MGYFNLETAVQDDKVMQDFDPSKGTEIQKKRPALICSHDILNENSSRAIVAPITSNLNKIYSFEFVIKNHPHIAGKIMLDQIRSIDKMRLGNKIGCLSVRELSEIEEILDIM